MIPMFKTPRTYRKVGALFMAVNIGNMVTFSGFISRWTETGTFAQGLMVIAFHLATIIILSATSGKLWADANKLENFIIMMEKNGFIYDKDTKDFRPGKKF